MFYLKTIFIFSIVYFLLLCNELYAQTAVDSLCTIKSNKTSLDSLSMKPSKAPIVAFGIVGALLGGAIGGTIDHPQKGVEGEMVFNISKTGASCFVIGGICGSYIGYRLAKRQVIKLGLCIKQ